MAETNVNPAHVQYVKEILENARSVLMLDRFYATAEPWAMRSKMMHAVNNESRREYYDVDFEGPWTVAGLRDWLEVIEAVSNELGKQARIETDYDASMAALWDWDIPYTEEEKHIAREWLESHPAPEPEPIQFRPMVPFNVQSVWIDDDETEPF